MRDHQLSPPVPHQETPENIIITPANIRAPGISRSWLIVQPTASQPGTKENRNPRAVANSSMMSAATPIRKMTSPGKTSPKSSLNLILAPLVLHRHLDEGVFGLDSHQLGLP